MAIFLRRHRGGGKVTSSWGNKNEIKLSQDRNTMYLKATGGGSHLYVLTAYTDKNCVRWRNHFGTLLVQKGEWELTWNKFTHKGKYLLIDQLVTGIRITVHASSDSAKNAVSGVFSDMKMDVDEFYAGYSCAACYRFLKDEVINFELGMTYSLISRSTKPGGLFYDDKTNSFRLLASLYLHLIVPYDMAKRLTTEKNHEYWREQFKSSKELKACWKYLLGFYTHFKWISRDHTKMRRAVNRLAQQCSFTTKSKIHRVRILLSGLEV